MDVYNKREAREFPRPILHEEKFVIPPCSRSSTAEFTSLLVDDRCCLALTNARSLLNKIAELEFFLDKFNIDIFSVTETWLSVEDPDSLFLPKEYTANRWDRPSRGGGVAFIIKKNIPFKPIAIPTEFQNIEITCIDVLLHTGPYRLITFYRRGGFDIIAEQYTKDSIMCIKFLSSVKYRVCLMGDFNLPGINWKRYSAPKNTIYDLFLELFDDLGFHQFVQLPTRNDNILDLILSGDSMLISAIDVICPLASSDHNTILFRLNDSVPQPTGDQAVSYNFSKGNYRLLNNYLSDIPWDHLFQCCFSSDECWRLFKCYLFKGVHRFISLTP